MVQVSVLTAWDRVHVSRARGRFITPIFLHAGLIHFLLNMLAQLTASAQVEREMGTISFLVLYAAAGIFGYVGFSRRWGAASDRLSPQ